MEKARGQNEQIKVLQGEIEDRNFKLTILEITNTVDKIIDTVSHDHRKYKKAETFFEYYLPVTIKILSRYDEIENQKLTSKDSEKFMLGAQKLINEVNSAFKKQLAGLYQKDIDDTDAEMKVFDMMLKSEGLDSNNMDVNEEEK